MGYADTNNCMSASCHHDIAVGSPVEKICDLAETPLPEGLYWPEIVQPDMSIIAKIVFSPPVEWGTNYVSWLDGASMQNFWFYHDNVRIVRIVVAPLLLTSTRPSMRPSMKTSEMFLDADSACLIWGAPVEIETFRGTGMFGFKIDGNGAMPDGR